MQKILLYILKKYRKFSIHCKMFFQKRSPLKRSDTLEMLGRKHGTDKTGEHFYLRHYQTHFEKFRHKNIKLLEIGVGGLSNTKKGGKSLRMWKEYFPRAKIFGIDIYDKSSLQEERIRIFQGSQSDESFLNTVLKETGKLDIIIDDGSHQNEHVIKTFEMLFPALKDGGIYVVEDTQTSYWQKYGGDSENLENPKTMMNFFKKLTDSLNNEEFIRPGYKKNYYDKKIISLHFYHNLIVIYKGNNDEKSNIIVNNQRV